MRRELLAIIGLWTVVHTVACDPGVATQVLVRFDADDAVRERAHYLRIRVVPPVGEARVVTEPLRGDGARVTWPATQPVHPREEEASQSFTVIGELLDADRQVFSQQTAVGRYALGQRREVRLRFEASCNDLISCAQGETCYQGACAPACVTPVVMGTGASRTPPRPCATHAKRLTIPGERILVSTTDFPLLVALGPDSDLANLARDDGGDFGFVDGTSGALLDHEVIAFNSATGSAVAWVHIPELTAGVDHSVDMLFGGTRVSSEPERVWTDYRGVWHLESSVGTTPDSSPYALAAIDRGPAVVEAGQIGNAVAIGDERSFSLGDPEDGHLDFSLEESFGLSAWVRVSPEHSSWDHVFYKGGTESSRAGYALSIVDGAVRGGMSDGSSHREAGRMALVRGEWTHLALLVDRTSQRMRVLQNGEEAGITADITGIDVDPGTGLDTDAYLGGTGGCCYLEGNLDEVMIWAGRRPEARIRMEFENQRDSATWIQIGPLRPF